MTLDQESTGVAGKPTGIQEVGTISQKRASVQGILDEVGCAPCETFDVEKKENALSFLTNPRLLGAQEYKTVESWQEYFHSLSDNPVFKDLKNYYNLGYINDEEILSAIEDFLRIKSAEMLAYLSNTGPLRPDVSRDLGTTHQKIFAWTLHKKLTIPFLTKKIYFGSTSAKSLLEKYSNGIELDLFIAITETLMPQEVREAQNR